MANILLIDDDSVLLKLYSTRLEADGHRVVTATNGEIALQQLITYKPDVIVLDLLMPKMNGFEFLEEMSKDPVMKAIPKIVFSSVSKAEQVARLENLGITHALNKIDVTPTQLVATIQSLIAPAS
jgi:CheY-like chemotaxis protein